MPPPITPTISLSGKPQNKKIVFDDEGEIQTKSRSDTLAKKPKSKQTKIGNANGHKQKASKADKDESVGAATISLSGKPQNKKIVFDDEGEIQTKSGSDTLAKKPKSKQKKIANANGQKQKESKTDKDESVGAGADDEEDYFEQREKQRLEQKESQDDAANKKWFNVYPQFPSSDEVLDMKENEQMELYNLCKDAFTTELPAFNKRNTADARWLQTALYKGTAKDRANAGALLVTSNPLGNLDALSSLISFTKISNKSSNEVISILTDLWREVLLPPHRKMLSLQVRGGDWKLVRKDASLSKERQRRIYAYWYFESELKDQYFEFLKNLQHGAQTGQDHNKNTSIVAASQLLAFAPEKEQMLLTMLINKLGDPAAKIASKALHHLSDVAHKHPNMCGVIVAEAEKLIFRNNISERAQHFALCFLASIAPAGRPEVCSKLVHICFSLFKVLVQKGAVNNRTMQAILRCLQKAILEAKPTTPGSTEVLSKDMQDTVYRLVHLADIRVSVQTLGLLLQLITANTEKSDRFYNALYKKLLDMEVTNIGVKTAAQLLHIVHRAIHIDSNVQRAQAFIKRLLQVALYMPAQMAAGCLIVIHKLLHTRKELVGSVASADESKGLAVGNNAIVPTVSADDEELAKFDSDGEEKYEDIRDEEDQPNAGHENNSATVDVEQKPSVGSSWHHAKVALNAAEGKVRDMAASKYDPYHRVPSFAGAEFALRDELLLLREHFHPTVQVFADNILHNKRIDYYGDPLRDFALPHFLERFAFKNPKKLDSQKVADIPTIAHKQYIAFGSRGKPVKSLTKANCTEDEMYIFNFLEQKRQRSVALKVKKPSKDEDEDDDTGLKPGEVDDDEFEEYLDGFFGKKAKAAVEVEEDAEELDFLKELGGQMKTDKKEKRPKKKTAAEDEDDVADIDADWGDDAEANELGDGEFEGEGSDLSDDEAGSLDGNEKDDEDDDDEGSISLDEDNEMEDFSGEELDESGDDSIQTDSDDELTPSKKKKGRKESGALGGKSFAKKLKHSDDMSSLFAAADDFAELLEETGKTKGQGTANALFNKDKSSEKQLKWEEKRHSNAKAYGKRTKTASGGQKSSKKRKH